MKTLLDVLSEKTGVSKIRLQWLSDNASKHYKVYTIPKKAGGERRIAQPTPELKSIQRWLVAYLIDRLAIHPSATAYAKGSSIKRNAEVHRRTSFTLHLDFENFFPSFQDFHITNFLRQKLDIAGADADFVSKIVTRGGCLTIGAPSSPAVSNALMYDFDREVARICNERNLVYSRYADDINISSFRPNSLNGIKAEIEIVARDFPFARLSLNEVKTNYLSRKYRRSITGINVTPDARLSVGRARKRTIKALVHRVCEGALSPEEKWQLGGMIAFVLSIEPSFVDSLRRKYGHSAIDGLLHREAKPKVKQRA